MKAVIGAIVAWLAKQFLPSTWVKAKLASIITFLLNRFFDLADSLAAKTGTDVDDKTVTALRSWLMADGVISHFIDVVWAMIFSEPPPTPVDPTNPPSPVTPPASPGFLKRLLDRIRGVVEKV